ncbi:MAG: AraC family transcriptional regulator ligand-binding domain-containing protein [Polyangiaceae bacterium]
MAFGSVALDVVRPALRAATARGVRDALLVAARIDVVLLDDPRAQISERQHAALWEALPRLTGVPEIGLEVGSIHALPETFGLLGFLAASSETIGDALEQIVAHHALLSRRSQIELAVGRRARIQIASLDGQTWPAALSDSWVATYATLPARVTGRPVVAERIGVMHRKPGYAEAYPAALGARAVFDQQHNFVELPRGILELPLAGRAPELAAVLRGAARDALERLPEEDLLLARLSALTLEALPRGRPKVDALARRLGLGARSLQRRLMERGLTYSAFLEQTLKKRAQEQLEHTSRGVSDIALELGFDDASAFARAFKRWTGASPSAWRRRAATGC